MDGTFVVGAAFCFAIFFFDNAEMTVAFQTALFNLADFDTLAGEAGSSIPRRKSFPFSNYDAGACRPLSIEVLRVLKYA